MNDTRPSIGSLGKRLFRPRFGCVLVANDSDKAELREVSEHMSSNIRTARVVAEILCKFFLPSVRSRVARLNRYLRNGESPLRILVSFHAYEALVRN